MNHRYCESRFKTIRRFTREVSVGDIKIGGGNPIRIQSMTTTNTQDIDATVEQAIALAEVGCEIIRVTAPNKAAARALKEIRSKFRAAGFDQPLVADIHFLPAAAMEAVEHVEKVRVNPGNYADNKKFATREYTDAQYEEELQRLYEEFSPLVIRSKELGRSLRIGTNHGSLSDRIMNRYGDTPLGMVESALEFLRIAESHSFKEIILSMKASNPKVMIEAYRLLVERMESEDMFYPLHLGVTEAGDGEDGRIKSAVGIGSLLFDGLGDTIRVSLTEDPVYEIPVAQELAQKAMAQWTDDVEESMAADKIDPYHFTRREVQTIEISADSRVANYQPPMVIARSYAPPNQPQRIIEEVVEKLPKLRDVSIEGLLLPIESPSHLDALHLIASELNAQIKLIVADLGSNPNDIRFEHLDWQEPVSLAFCQSFTDDDSDSLVSFLDSCKKANALPILSLTPTVSPAFLKEAIDHPFIATLERADSNRHEIGQYRLLAQNLQESGINAPLWIRCQSSGEDASFLSNLLDASILSGSLLCDGIGDLISIESETDLARSTRLAYNVLQGAGARISKTEFVACPSCGRTLFDLQSTTQRIRKKTGHLKGVKIAIMGCIVNGPGEMADADFGYVGGAPGMINLYVGKECVEYNISQAEADERLIHLIKSHGKWVEEEPAAHA